MAEKDDDGSSFSRDENEGHKDDVSPKMTVL